MKRWRISMSKVTAVTSILLLALIAAVISQSIYRTRQAQALSEELEAIGVLSESDHDAAQQRYLAVLPKKWAVEENAPILNIGFMKSDAYLPYVEIDAIDSMAPRRGSGWSNYGVGDCPPNCYTMEELQSLSRLPLFAFDPERADMDGEYKEYFEQAQNESGVSGNYEDLNFVLVNQPHLNVFGWKAAGFYNPSARTIFLPVTFVNDRDVIVHEMKHYLERKSGSWRLPIHGRAFRSER